MGNINQICAKEKLKPWIIGLVVLVLVIVGWTIFNRGGQVNGSVRNNKMITGKINMPEQTGTAIDTQYSYNAIVQMVRSSIVGISLSSSAQPFLQKWPNVKEPGDALNVWPPTNNAQTQPQAWGGANTLTMLCPNCRTNVSRQPSTPWSSIACPNCGSSMFCPAGGNATPQAQQVALAPCPGACPGCPLGTPQIPAQLQAQLQAWGFGSNTLTMACPNCKTNVSRQPGTPWSSIACPNCGSSMFCPAGVTRQQVQQPAAVAQPQAQTTQETKDEYLSCPNCSLRINHQPGIPWSGAKCPSCGTTLAHVIALKSQVNNTQQVWQPFANTQPQALQPGVQVPPQVPQNTMAPQQGMAQGTSGNGTGVIVSAKGYILTNSHLLNGQTNVVVTIFSAQGQQQIPGQVVANAADRDLAIIKIDTQNLKLSAAPIGNSDTAQVGETVLAFGNPFGLSQTVTSGIVSAIRQSITIEGHQLRNLIQTDAPINQGNSGGPLVNTKGEIIGINTAIYSPAQTHTGLGFAVPINQAKEVFSVYMDVRSAQRVAMQYLKYSTPRPFLAAGAQQNTTPTDPNLPPADVVVPKVIKRVVPTPLANTPEDAPVWLGINMQVMNDVLAEQLQVPVDRGILINEVYANSPAAVAGLQRGDVIIKFDGRRVTDETIIRTMLAGKKAGDNIRLTILRGKKRIDVKIETYAGAWQQAIQQMPKKKPSNLLKGAEIETGSAELTSIGLGAINLTPEVAFSYGLPENTQGVIAAETEGLSLKYGMLDGDMIVGVNGADTPDLLTLLKVIKKCRLSEGIEFSLVRKGQPITVIVKDPRSLVPKGL